MDFIGTWKLKGINMPTENGPVTYTKENLPPELEETFQEAAVFTLEFSEDGTLKMLAEPNEEQLQQAKEEGLEIREDGYIVAMDLTWKEVDGKIFYDSGARGEILDEEIDPFVELTFNEDGYLLYNFDMLLYERV